MSAVLMEKDTLEKGSVRYTTALNLSLAEAELLYHHSLAMMKLSRRFGDLALV